MAVWRYKISAQVLKNISRVSTANMKTTYQHEKRNSYLQAMSLPFYCINFHNTWCFWWFFEDFNPLSEDSPKFVQRPDKPYEKFPIESFLKFFKGNQRLSKTYKNVLRMFCSCTNKFKCSLRDKNVIKNKIFMCGCHLNSHSASLHPGV